MREAAGGCRRGRSRQQFMVKTISPRGKRLPQDTSLQFKKKLPTQMQMRNNQDERCHCQIPGNICDFLFFFSFAIILHPDSEMQTARSQLRHLFLSRPRDIGGGFQVGVGFQLSKAVVEHSESKTHVCCKLVRHFCGNIYPNVSLMLQTEARIKRKA